MTVPRRRRVAYAVTLIALLAPALSRSSASAAPVFDDQITRLSGYAEIGAIPIDVPCEAAGDPGADSEVGVPENGGVRGGPLAASATVSVDGAPIASVTSRSAGQASITSATGNPATLDFSVSAATQVTTSASALGGCLLLTQTGHDLTFQFTVARAGFLRVASSADSGIQGTFALFSEADDSAVVGLEGRGFSFAAAKVVFLPAGTYYGVAEGRVRLETQVAGNASGTVSVHAVFHEAGSRTEPVVGRGAGYLSLPSSRSCLSHAVPASVVSDAKRAERIKKVRLYVNGELVQKVRDPGAAQLLTVPVVDAATADVTARVTLERLRHQKRSKVLAVRSAYEACAPAARGAAS